MSRYSHAPVIQSARHVSLRADAAAVGRRQKGFFETPAGGSVRTGSDALGRLQTEFSKRKLRPNGSSTVSRLKGAVAAGRKLDITSGRLPQEGLPRQPLPDARSRERRSSLDVHQTATSSSTASSNVLADIHKSQLQPLRYSKMSSVDIAPGRIRPKKIGLLSGTTGDTSVGLAFAGSASAAAPPSQHHTRRRDSMLPKNINDHVGSRHNFERRGHESDGGGGFESDASTASHHSLRSNASHDTRESRLRHVRYAHDVNKRGLELEKGEHSTRASHALLTRSKPADLSVPRSSSLLVPHLQQLSGAKGNGRYRLHHRAQRKEAERKGKISQEPTPSTSDEGKPRAKDGLNRLRRSPLPSTKLSLERRPSGLVGLQNLGNTCFMNSCLQCVSNVRPLVDHVLNFNEDTDLNENSFTKGQLAVAFKRLLAVTQTAEPFSSTRPAAVKKAVGKLAKRFIGFKQQDAQEFLRFLLDGLHDDLNRVVKKPAYVELKDAPEQSDLEASNRWWDNYCCRNISQIKDLFCGQLRSEVVCQTCKARSIAYDPFWDLSVSIPKKHQRGSNAGDPSSGAEGGSSSRRLKSARGRSGRARDRTSPKAHKGKCKLYDCLAQLTETEELTGNDAYYCSKCKKHQTSIKRMCIFRVPRVLVVHVKRFSYRAYRRTKLQTNIEFPVKELDLYDFCWTKDATAMDCGPTHSSSDASGDRTAYIAAHPLQTSETGATDEFFATAQPPSVRPIYDLVAVSNHMGECGGGHYTADCFKSKDGSWYRFNDARVSEISTDNLDGVSAYLLFYLLREPTKLGEISPTRQARSNL